MCPRRLFERQPVCRRGREQHGEVCDVSEGRVRLPRPAGATRFGFRRDCADTRWVGDERYVYGPDALRPIAFGRQALHAYRLRCQHRTDGRTMTFEAPPPADFNDLLACLRGAAR